MAGTGFTGPLRVTVDPTAGTTFTDVEAVDDLTDSSTGTADDTIVEVTDTTSDVSGLINDNFATVAAQLVALNAAIAALQERIN